jgi:ABC-type uncharacterized transport system ATPase component
MHHRLYQVRSKSEKLLRVITRGKELFFHAAPMSSSHLAGRIQDDTDLHRTLKSQLITPLRLYSAGLRQWISIAMLIGLSRQS